MRDIPAKWAAAINDIVEERWRAHEWPPFNSAHEGYAILLEEVDELWQHVKHNQKTRDVGAMYREAVQVAAMALRFITDVCNEDRGNR